MISTVTPLKIAPWWPGGLFIQSGVKLSLNRGGAARNRQTNQGSGAPPDVSQLDPVGSVVAILPRVTVIFHRPAGSSEQVAALQR